MLERVDADKDLVHVVGNAQEVEEEVTEKDSAEICVEVWESNATGGDRSLEDVAQGMFDGVITAKDVFEVVDGDKEEAEMKLKQ